MTNEEQERLVYEAWQRVWSDHLRNQEDIPINKNSFYKGFREALKLVNLRECPEMLRNEKDK